MVDYAHARRASKPGGYDRRAEDDVVGESIFYADLNECVELVKATNVDFLAPALGSVHGPYKGEPKLGFKEMEEIKNATNVPLVLHGGTGIPDDMIKRAISCGTTKINVNTECQMAFARSLRSLLAENNEVYDPRRLSDRPPKQSKVGKEK